MPDVLRFSKLECRMHPAVADPFPAPIPGSLNTVTGQYSLQLRAALQEAVIERGLTGYYPLPTSGFLDPLHVYWGTGTVGTLRIPVPFFRGSNWAIVTREDGPLIDEYDRATFRLFADPWSRKYYDVPLTYSMRYALGNHPWVVATDEFDTEVVDLPDVPNASYATHEDLVPAKVLQLLDDVYVEEHGGFTNGFQHFPERCLETASRLFPLMKRTLFGAINKETSTFADFTDAVKYNQRNGEHAPLFLLDHYLGGTGYTYTGTKKIATVPTITTPGHSMAAAAANTIATGYIKTAEGNENIMQASGGLLTREGEKTITCHSVSYVEGAGITWSFLPSEAVGTVLESATLCILREYYFVLFVSAPGGLEPVRIHIGRRFKPVQMTKGVDGTWSAAFGECMTGPVYPEPGGVARALNLAQPYVDALSGYDHLTATWSITIKELPIWLLVNWDFKAFI